MQPDLVATHRLGKPRRTRRESGLQKLSAAFELFEIGVTMKREQLRRNHPRASGQKVEQLLRAWLIDKPPLDEAGGPWRRRQLPR